MQATLAAAIENLRRERVLDQTNAGYARLRRNKATWSRISGEREAWDITLGDGIAE
jgi:hypothetical protein